jgi:hypothetical protein
LAHARTRRAPPCRELPHPTELTFGAVEELRTLAPLRAMRHDGLTPSPSMLVSGRRSCPSRCTSCRPPAGTASRTRPSAA